MHECFHFLWITPISIIFQLSSYCKNYLVQYFILPSGHVFMITVLKNYLFLFEIPFYSLERVYLAICSPNHFSFKVFFLQCFTSFCLLFGISWVFFFFFSLKLLSILQGKKRKSKLIKKGFQNVCAIASGNDVNGRKECLQSISLPRAHRGGASPL